VVRYVLVERRQIHSVGLSEMCQVEIRDLATGGRFPARERPLVTWNEVRAAFLEPGGKRLAGIIHVRAKALG
jgi:hypothetical protein